MKNYNIVPIRFKNGIQRDGTPYNGLNCIEGQWTRFYEGSARKMGGYEVTDPGDIEIARSLFPVPKANSIDLYIGRASTLNYINIDIHGGADVEINRTPSTYVPNENNIWSFDLFTTSDSITGEVSLKIVAQVCPNGNDISNNVEGPLYYGDVDSDAPLAPIFYPDGTTPVKASGGIIFSSPFMVLFGKDGVIRWCEAGDITSWPLANFLVVSNTKLVASYPSRGGAAAPSLLIWSLNSLNRVTYIRNSDSTFTFSSTTIEDSITVMSSNCIVKYNQMFFWIGVDQFYFFNGIVQKLVNNMNNDWFFENVNLNQRQKIWGVSVPRYKEIWFFYPRNIEGEEEATECNAAVIYNLEEDVWYDTLISRSCGIQTSIYPFPIFASSTSIRTLTTAGAQQTFPLWTHEIGTNRVEGTNVYAIDSYFETNQISLWDSSPEASNYILSQRIAPDFVQIGTMTVTINVQNYPNSKIVSDGPYPFIKSGDNPTEFIDFNSQGALVSFLFRSNEVDGFYQSGKSLYFFYKGDTFK